MRCECGLDVFNKKGVISSHEKSTRHRMFLQYKDITVDGRVYCNSCESNIAVRRYEDHLQSKYHTQGIKKPKPDDIKIDCECGKKFYEEHRALHENTKYHKNELDKIGTKKEEYNRNKDLNNCCSRCLATKIKNRYYMMYDDDDELCLCCDEILKGGEKECQECNQMKDINTFERPYLLRCKPCCAIKARQYRLHKKSN